MKAIIKRIVPWRIQRPIILTYRKLRKEYLTRKNEIKARKEISQNKTNKRKQYITEKYSEKYFPKQSVRSQRKKKKVYGQSSMVLETKIELAMKKLFSDIELKVESLALDNLQYHNDAKKLFFVEQNSCHDQYNWIVQLLMTENKNNSTFIFKTKKDYLGFLESIDNSSELALLIDKHVHVMPSIDPELDDIVYEQADTYAQQILEGIVQQLGRLESLREYTSTIMSLKVNISDRLSHWIRVFRYVSDYIELNQTDKLIIVENKSMTPNLLTLAIKASLNIDISVLTLPHISRTAYNPWDSIRRASLPYQTLRIKRYPFHNHMNEDNILIFGNIADPMYRESIQPVIDNINQISNKKLLVIPNAPVEYYDENDRISILNSTTEVDNLPGAIETLDSLDNTITHFIEEGADSSVSESLFRLYLTLNTRSSIYRLLRDVNALKYDIDHFYRHNKISSIVSCPGRMWPSLYLVNYLSNVPSVEIQTGTISRTKRYKKLYSDTMLAMDDFSKNVFIDYQGYAPENVIVMGSPRIDKRLEKIRLYTKHQSRLKVALTNNDCKIICVTTQPYGIELMRSMVNEVAKFVENHDDWFLLISMHHNESEEYERVYLNILESLIEKDRAAISRKNVYHNINASDMVITYFSTTGLEAFCLGKQVYSYRSDNSEVPYDLCELGVAQPFRSSRDLGNYIKQTEQKFELTEGLERLRDGQSVKRISEYILKVSM